jgi:hypothetical protein
MVISEITTAILSPVRSQGVSVLVRIIQVFVTGGITLYRRANYHHLPQPIKRFIIN